MTDQELNNACREIYSEGSADDFAHLVDEYAALLGTTTTRIRNNFCRMFGAPGFAFRRRDANSQSERLVAQARRQLTEENKDDLHHDHLEACGRRVFGLDGEPFVFVALKLKPPVRLLLIDKAGELLRLPMGDERFRQLYGQINPIARRSRRPGSPPSAPRLLPPD